MSTHVIAISMIVEHVIRVGFVKNRVIPKPFPQNPNAVTVGQEDQSAFVITPNGRDPGKLAYHLGVRGIGEAYDAYGLRSAIRIHRCRTGDYRGRSSDCQ